jgi:pSer/pThr/pTyr-binding forkhead associated (FHA) protein
MTSPPAIQLMRFAFLALLWLFLFGLVRVIRAELRSSGLPRVQVGASGKRRNEPRRQPVRQTRPPRGTPTQLVITEGGLAGTTIALSGKAILIGRANDSTLVLTDDYASTRHARISELNGTWYVEDLGSTNGTYIGTKKVDGPVPIEAGVAIRIGRTVMELR